MLRIEWMFSSEVREEDRNRFRTTPGAGAVANGSVHVDRTLALTP